MKKFTLYQAARFSKISRYKLEQAIKEGLLTTLTGKGNIKCFIYENELNKFIEEYGDQFRRFEFEDEKKLIMNPDITTIVPRDLHNKMLDEKERIIQLLQEQNERILPLIDDSDKIRLQVSRHFEKTITQLNSLCKEAINAVDKKELKESLLFKLETLISSSKQKLTIR